MEAEREIILWWLNKEGYFTLHSIKAAQNREIDILAIKVEKGSLKKIVHVESATSISSSDAQRPQKYLERFTSPSVRKKLAQVIRDYLGVEAGYERMLVIGSTHRLKEFKELEDITIKEFKDVIYDVLQNLDRQNYFNSTIRTLQVMKFILLADPKRLSQLLQRQDAHQALKKTSKKEFVRDILSDEQGRRALTDKEGEQLVVQILKHSSLNTPEQLAKTISEDVLTPRSRRRFIAALLAQESMIKAAPRPKAAKKEKSLRSFFR